MIGVLPGVIARKRLRKKRQRHRDKPDPWKGDLDVSIGSFLVCEKGVTARLSSPFPSLLSRHYEWSKVPMGIAALKLATAGEGRCASLIYSQMSEKQKDVLESRLGEVVWTCEEGIDYLDHESEFIDSVQEVWDWVPSLVSRCPYQSVAHDLMMVCDLNDEALDKYVMSRLL